jgi:L-asparaginase
MMRDPDSKVLIPFNFNELMDHIPEIKQLDCEIESVSYSTPIDSSNMNIECWQSLGDIIHERYDEYDGFVVLHGSDTMSYTGSALSFMFENLSKPIILTGSQLPIGDLRTDAKENLITSIQLATAQSEEQMLIHEVCIYFEYQLYRANRTYKRSAQQFEAFASPNYGSLAISGVNLSIYEHRLWRWSSPTDHESDQDMALRYWRDLDNRVAILKIFPGMPVEYVRAILDNPEFAGIILETYGSGNAPTDKWFIDTLERALLRGVKIVNVTQCHSGSVVMGKYHTSVALKKMGLIDGKDMTSEAALAKMMHLLAQGESPEKFKRRFEASMRGEVT